MPHGLARYRRQIQEVFAATADLYYEFWGPYFHLAIWDDPAIDLPTAFERTHNGYLESLRGRRARRILELGCGGGAFSEWLASRVDGHVLGIDISGTQLERARRRVRPNLRFRAHDIMDVAGLEEPPFDAAVCLDAAVYLPDKGRAVAGLARVLTPGARFLLVDWCRPERVTDLQHELILAPFYRYWGIPAGMETPGDYRRHLAAAGFRLIECDDLSARVGRNWQQGYDAAHAALRTIGADRRPGGAALRLMPGALARRWAKDQYYAVVFAKAAADAGLLRYVRFLAERT